MVHVSTSCLSHKAADQRHKRCFLRSSASRSGSQSGFSIQNWHVPIDPSPLHNLPLPLSFPRMVPSWQLDVCGFSDSLFGIPSRNFQLPEFSVSQLFLCWLIHKPLIPHLTAALLLRLDPNWYGPSQVRAASKACSFSGKPWVPWFPGVHSGALWPLAWFREWNKWIHVNELIQVARVFIFHLAPWILLQRRWKERLPLQTAHASFASCLAPQARSGWDFTCFTCFALHYHQITKMPVILSLQRVLVTAVSHLLYFSQLLCKVSTISVPFLKWRNWGMGIPGSCDLSLKRDPVGTQIGLEAMWE